MDPAHLNLLQAMEQTNSDTFIKLYSEMYPQDLSQPKIHQNFQDIPGLWYIPKFLTEKEIAVVEALIKDTQLKPITNTPHSRRVAHFGYEYSYDRSGTRPADPIPEPLQSLVSKPKINNMLGIHLLTQEFNQLIINEYKPNQQISYHTDHTTQFGSIIACLTVGTAVPIKFQLGATERTVEVGVGSLYIMTEDARYKWKHALRNETDQIRYSLTYRTVMH